MKRIHWLGAGLSAGPGIHRLAENGHAVTVWNRTIEKARQVTAGLSGNVDVRSFSIDALKAALSPGDIAVSMLPGDFHVPVARICLEKNAHFVSSSYISPEMRALDTEARDRKLVLINEVGLDPGIDHLMAHVLMDDYRKSDAFSTKNAHYFRSYCGGLSEFPNDFRYKFSWSPLGVLKALRSPSKSLRNGAEYVVSRPWEAIEPYEVELKKGCETFEVYPNRDSLPYLAEYGFTEDWNTQLFVRGTLRYGGWSTAWAGIFKEVETLEGESGDRRLAEISAGLWDKYAVGEGEVDRVLLCVDLWAERDGDKVYDKSYVMDACGDSNHTAMARLVSTTVSIAVEALKRGDIPPGVHAAPSDAETARRWLAVLKEGGEKMAIVNRLESA